MNRAEFFKKLYQFCDGNIEIRPLLGEQGFFALDDTAAIAAHCRRYSANDLYFGVATRNGGGGTKADIVNIPAVWCDVDFKQTPRDIIADRLKNFPFKPTICVKSGGGEHLYFILDEPVGQDKIDPVEDANRRIAIALGGDLNACDAARILRIPDTLNRKYDPPRKCEVARMDDFYYDVSDFLEILPQVEHRTAAADTTNDSGWLDELMSGVETGNRNAAGAKIAGYWINKLTVSDVITILETWNNQNTPPLDPKEIQTIVKSVSRYQSEIETKNRVDIVNVYDSAEMVEAYQQHIANLKKNRFRTGVHEIDKRIRGVAAGEVLTLIARAGAFKTAMLQNFLKNYVQNSAWAAVFFSIEMPVASVTERYFQMLDGCTGPEVEAMFNNTTNTEIRDAAVGQFVKNMERLFVVPVRTSLSDISAYVQLIESARGVKVGVIGIDYLGLMDGPGANTYETVSRLAVGAKNIAKLLNIPVILLSQASRKGGSGQVEISLDMGRDSGAIEEGADFVLGLWQIEGNNNIDQVPPDPDRESKKGLVCKILKNRKGPAGSTWKLELVAHAMRIGSGAVPFENKTHCKTKLSV